MTNFIRVRFSLSRVGKSFVAVFAEEEKERLKETYGLIGRVMRLETFHVSPKQVYIEALGKNLRLKEIAQMAEGNKLSNMTNEKELTRNLLRPKLAVDSIAEVFKSFSFVDEEAFDAAIEYSFVDKQMSITSFRKNQAVIFIRGEQKGEVGKVLKIVDGMASKDNFDEVDKSFTAVRSALVEVGDSLETIYFPSYEPTDNFHRSFSFKTLKAVPFEQFHRSSSLYTKTSILRFKKKGE